MAVIKTKPTLTRARALGAKIKTAKQARAALRLTRITLRRSIGMMSGFSRIDLVFTRIHAAWVSRIEMQIKRIAALQKRLGTGLTPKLADQIGLAVIQATHTLKQLGRAVKKSQSQTAVSALLDQFAEALRQVLAAAIETTAKAVPWYVWAGAAFLLFS